MGKYSVPEKIRKMKPKGTAVKPYKNGFYVYAQKHIKDEKTGKWKIKTGAYLGKIDPKQGFIPASIKISNDFSVCEFGQYAFPYLAANDVKLRLEQFFGKELGSKIYLVAIVHLVNGFSYQKFINKYVNMSFLNLIIHKTKFGEKAISNFYSNLGLKINEIDKFEQSLYCDSKQISIDGHSIASSSNLNDLTRKGNKYPILKNEQVNLIMGYDTQRNIPVFSQMTVGDCIDSISFRETFGRRIFKDILLTIDKGFFNLENLELIEQNGCTFIIPAKENYSYLKKLKMTAKFLSQPFIYKSNSTKSVVYFEQLKIGKRTLYGFRDLSVHAKECADYIEKVEQEKNGYTNEHFEEVKDNFGTVWLLTNSDLPPNKVFETYKQRWDIETFYNQIKNKLDFNALHCQNYYVEQALAFMILVTSLIQVTLKQKLKTNKLENLDEFLMESRAIKLRKDNNIWSMVSVTMNLLNKCKSCGADLVELVKEINELETIKN